MSRMLAIIAVISLVLSIAFLGLAVRIGGDDVLHDAGSLKAAKPLIDLATRKEWRWKGGDTLALDAPINIRYRQDGPANVSAPNVSAPNISVTGPAEVLDHVRVGGGRIGSDSGVTRSSGAQLQAVISGVAIRKFVVNGGEKLDLGEINQPDLDLHINGDGKISGHGKAGRLDLVISGSGKADLGRLSVGDARISIFGSGRARVSPHGDVQLIIAGSGKLDLLAHPASLRQTIIGSGKVSQVPADEVAPDSPPPPPAPPPGQIQVPIPMPMPMQMQVDPRTGEVSTHGSKNIDLGHVEQATLNVAVASSGSVTGEGKVDTLNVVITGSGHANLGRIAARKVTVQIMGSGKAFVAPAEELKATIMGSGDVHLLTHPARIERSIAGSGRIVEDH